MKVDLLRGRALSKRYGATAALRGVNVELPAGRLTRIEGANGSGKSTLLALLGWAAAPSSGVVEILCDGVVLEPAVARGTLGWVSHETLAYADLSGRANVELAAALRGLPIDEAWRAIAERFELGSFAERPLRTNSRGQRQRIALARALVHRPSILLLDEPTTGLDASGLAQLLRVVEEELADQAIVAVVTHEPGVFERFGDERVVLERGRRVA